MNSTFLANGLLLCSLIIAPSVLAHLPELYGRQYIRISESADKAAADSAVSPLAVPSKRDQLQHDKSLADAEMVGGPYGAGLVDPLVNLAHYHRKRGDDEQSLETLRRALHLVRLNDGLASARQIPILREMLELYRAMGDYRTLGDAYQYYYGVRELGDPPQTEEQLDVSLEYLGWEQELYVARVDGSQRIHLLRAYRANESMLASAPTTPQQLDGYLRLSMSQMRNLYLLLGEEQLPLGGSGTGKKSADAADRELAYIQLTAFSRGKKVLENCIEYAHAAPPAELAALHLELGDWYQWNDQRRRASSQYLRVVELLRGAGQEQLLGRWLDLPVELPDEVNVWLHLRTSDSATLVVVEALFDVSAQGDVKRVTASVVDEQDAWQAGRIKRMLRNTHFRPRFSQGVAEAAKDVSGHYKLVDRRRH